MSSPLNSRMMLLLLTLCAPRVLADAAPDARRAVEAAYAKMDAAMMASDPTVYARVCTPDARFTQPGQPPKTVAQVTQELTPLMALWRGLKTHTAVDAMTVSRDGAVVQSMQTTDLVLSGQPLHEVTRNKDTWALTPSGWRLALSETVSDTMTPGAAPPPDPALTRALVAQLRAAAIPLTTTDPAAPRDDLAPVGALVGDARVVALGEASHGTREFFQMKHRLLEYLVTKKGFTVFALEANWPETRAVDQYVKTGEGDPRAALAGLNFWTWNTQEMLDLIAWMRAYNAAPGAHAVLSFTGFDMQTPDIALARVERYLQTVDPAAVPAMRAGYAPLRGLMDRQARPGRRGAMGMPEPPPAATADACRAGADAVAARLDARRTGYVRASSEADFRDARQNARIVAQAARMMTSAVPEALGLRDRAMADNVRWLAEQKYPGQKIVLWAHNAHVGTFDLLGSPSMGTYLRAGYGPALRVLGFAFSRGEVRAIPMAGGRMTGPPGSLPVPPAAEGTGDALLHQAGLPRFLLDFRRVAPGSPLGAWLSAPHPFQMPDATWDPSAPVQHWRSLAPAAAYDGLIYIDESHATRALPFPKRTTR